jgi:hypothetical protein
MGVPEGMISPTFVLDCCDASLFDRWHSEGDASVPVTTYFTFAAIDIEFASFFLWSSAHHGWTKSSDGVERGAGT